MFFCYNADVFKGGAMLNLPVSDIMNDHPIKVKADAPVAGVAHLLLRYRINGILVVSPDDQEKLVGVFTTSYLLEIMEEVLSSGHQKMQILKQVGSGPVSAFLHGEIDSLQVTDNAAKAVALMHKKSAVTIPVFDGEKLVGVVGRHDIINIAFA